MEDKLAVGGAAVEGATLDERRLRRLLEVGRSLVSQLDLDQVLSRFLDVARELTDARYGALAIAGPDRTIERVLTLGIDDEAKRAIGPDPTGCGVLGLFFDEPKPIRLDDVSRHPRFYGFPPHHPPMTSFLAVPIRLRDEVYGNLYLTEKAGDGEFTAVDEGSAEVLAEWAGIAIRNARLYSDSVDRGKDLERAVSRLEATAEIALAVGGETRLEHVLETIVERARALVEASSVVVLLEDRRDLVVSAGAGEFRQEPRGARLRDPSAWWAGAELGAERIDEIGARLGDSVAELGIDAHAALLAPLVFRGRRLGVLAAFDRLRDGPHFKDEDERLLAPFAASAATAVATAQSVAEGRLRQSIAVAERERGRWARELHDETLQGLGALRVLLASALRTGDAHNLESAASDALEQIASEIENLRSLITELRPAALDELGLGAALESLAKNHAVANGQDVSPDLALRHESGTGGKRLDRELESAIYRLVQEALTNVAKHAKADSVWIEVSESDDAILVAVRDDGVGFDPARRGTHGFGLLGMRERVALSGGTLAIVSTPGAGTELRARVPLNRGSVGGADDGQRP